MAWRSTLAAVALHTGMNLGIVHASRGAVTVAWIVCAGAAMLALGMRPAGSLAGSGSKQGRQP